MRISFRQRAQGFSLLEVLIALIVLSVGLLGLAALQGRGQQFNHNAYVRTQAAFFAYDIMDRMRVNRDAAVQGLYVSKTGNRPTALTADCDTTACMPKDLAVYDLFHWYSAVEAILPEGEANISTEVLSSGESFVVITIEWSQGREEQTKIKQEWRFKNA